MNLQNGTSVLRLIALQLGKTVKVVEVEAYNGTLYTRVSRARWNSTQIRHTVLLVS